VHTEQQHWTSHHEVPMFISRPLFLIHECKRILSGNKSILTRPHFATHFEVLNYECVNTATSGNGAHLASEHLSGREKQTPWRARETGSMATSSSLLDAPAGLPNIGNTCYFNALMQCFKQMLLRVPSYQLPQSRTCPLANALQHEVFTPEEICEWDCWTYLPVGCQRDACHVLEMCLDPEGCMHRNCQSGDCYGELLRNMTCFELTLELICDCCPYVSDKSQPGCVLRVEPCADLETSIHAALAVREVAFNCESVGCGGKKARQQTSIDQLPQVLVVHINKYAHCSGPTIGASMRVLGTELQRIAVVHHEGDSPASGHYTSTVATQSGQAYHCNDIQVIALKPNLNAWENGYLIFLQADRGCDAQHEASGMEETINLG